MPDDGIPSSSDGHAGGAQGTRRRDALLHVSRARVLDRTRCPRTISPTGSASTPTPCASTSSGSARRAWSTSRPCTAAPSAVPARLLARRRARPGSGSTRRATRSSRVCSAALAERMGADAEEAAEIGRRWGVEAGRRTRSRSCAKALVVRARTARLRSGRAKTKTTAMSRSPSCTARSGSWPRPIRSWCATSTAASARVS